MDKLKELINQGVAYEDDFISTYMGVLNDPEFLKYFGNNQDKAKTLINTLIKESRLHKNILVNIMDKF